MVLTQVVKDNPIKSLTSMVGIVSLVLGAFMAIDTRYAHSADVKELQQQLIINDTKSDIRSLKSRKLQLEDKVIESNIKQQRTQLSDSEKIIAERYKLELNDVNEEIRRKSINLQRLETNIDSK